MPKTETDHIVEYKIEATITKNFTTGETKVASKAITYALEHDYNLHIELLAFMTAIISAKIKKSDEEVMQFVAQRFNQDYQRFKYKRNV